MDDEQSVIHTNEAFYKAFAEGDFEAMIEVWAHDDDIACTHPGWDVLTGYHDVMESWRTIMDGDALPQIVCQDSQAFVFGDAAFVTCNEVVNDGYLVATNFFVRKNDEWRMVHHQAGPCPANELAFASAPPGPLH